MSQAQIAIVKWYILCFILFEFWKHFVCMCVWMYLFYVQSIYAITIWNPLIYSVAILFKIYPIYFNKLFIGFVLSLWATWSHLECMLWISLFWIDKYVCLFVHLIIYESNYMGSSTFKLLFLRSSLNIYRYIYTYMYKYIGLNFNRGDFQCNIPSILCSIQLIYHLTI